MLKASLHKQEIVNTYRRLAPIYDAWGQLTESKAQARCLDIANIKDGEAILEVAVGTGQAFIDILARNPSGNNEGLDLTEAMLAQAHKKIKAAGFTNYNLAVGDAYELAFPDSSFDLLINNYMFDLLPKADFVRVLTEFKRVLRPNGRLVLVNMARDGYWYNRLWEKIYQINPVWLGGCRGVSLLPYVQQVGFGQTTREFISQMTFPSEIIAGVK